MPNTFGNNKQRSSQHQEEVQQGSYQYRHLDGTDVTGGLTESEVPLLGWSAVPPKQSKPPPPPSPPSPHQSTEARIFLYTPHNRSSLYKNCSTFQISTAYWNKCRSHYFVSAALHMYFKILATYHADIIYQTLYQYGQSAVAGVLFLSCHTLTNTSRISSLSPSSPYSILRTKVSLFRNLQSVSYFNRLIGHYKFLLSSRSKLILHSNHVRHLQQPILQKLLCERLQWVQIKTR